MAKENLILLKRCPDSDCLRNKQGQNIYHIRAKCGKDRSFPPGYREKFVNKRNHMMEEQDVDGNTPLHLASINWRPRTIYGLTMNDSRMRINLNIRNKDGLRALDIAELRLQSAYVLRERLTFITLLCLYKPKGVGLISTSGMTLRSRSEQHLDANKYKEQINILLLVAALVATMTFAAGFTIPGGFNSSAPNLGMAILAKDHNLSYFLFCDALAMQSSVVAIVALLWAQLGDPAIVHKAFHLALPSLLIALCSMSWAFYWGILATMKQNGLLINVIMLTFIIFQQFMAVLLCPYVLPQVLGIRSLDWTILFLFFPLILVNEDDDANHYTYSFGELRVDTVGSPNNGQVKKETSSQLTLQEKSKIF